MYMSIKEEGWGLKSKLLSLKKHTNLKFSKEKLAIDRSD